jgi:hypothetical protein
MRVAARPTERFFYGWVIVLVGAVLTFLGTGFYSYSRGVFLPSLAEELAGGSRFEIAMGFSIAAVTSALVAPFIGGILPTLVLLSEPHPILFNRRVRYGAGHDLHG